MGEVPEKVLISAKEETMALQALTQLDLSDWLEREYQVK